MNTVSLSGFFFFKIFHYLPKGVLLNKKINVDIVCSSLDKNYSDKKSFLDAFIDVLYEK